MSRIKHRIVEPLYISRHRNLNDSHTNSKSKALNPKQIHINQIQSPKRNNVILTFESSPSEDRLDEFRI